MNDQKLDQTSAGIQLAIPMLNNTSEYAEDDGS